MSTNKKVPRASATSISVKWENIPSLATGLGRAAAGLLVSRDGFDINTTSLHRHRAVGVPHHTAVNPLVFCASWLRVRHAVVRRLCVSVPQAHVTTSEPRMATMSDPQKWKPLPSGKR